MRVDNNRGIQKAWDDGEGACLALYEGDVPEQVMLARVRIGI